MILSLPIMLMALTAALPVDEARVSAAVEQAVQKEFDAGLFPGAVVLVGNGDTVLHHAAFGWAQVVPDRAPMRKDSIFDVASITKVVCTATAIGICKDRGLIDPDAAMTKYLPDHKGKGAGLITLRDMGSHTAGFRDGDISPAGQVKGAAFFARALRLEPSWPVNDRYQYSSPATILLGMMVEHATGRELGEFCVEQIFKPLEMTDSAFNVIDPSPRVVATHHAVLGESHNSDSRVAGRAVGHAGLFTTAGDLSNFCQMMLGGGSWRGRRVLSARTVADFTTLHQLPRFPGRGFLWEMDVNSNHRPQRMSPAAYGHSGNTGVSVWIDPRKKVYAIVMTNRNHPRHEKYASGKEPTNTPRGIQQYKARGRIADAALEALGY